MTEYNAVGGFIVKSIHTDWQEYLCTVPEAACAWRHLQKGPAICETRGHDYAIRVALTPNMYTCFRCGEAGWEMPG